jgi:hypothetical protein
LKPEPQRYAVPAPSITCCSTLKVYTGNSLFVHFLYILPCFAVWLGRNFSLFSQQFSQNSGFRFREIFVMKIRNFRASFRENFEIKKPNSASIEFNIVKLALFAQSFCKNFYERFVF